MKKNYLEQANKIIEDPRILINLVSIRVKQLRSGMEPLVESLEKLDLEDLVLKEIIENKIFYEFSEDFNSKK